MGGIAMTSGLIATLMSMKAARELQPEPQEDYQPPSPPPTPAELTVQAKPWKDFPNGHVIFKKLTKDELEGAKLLPVKLHTADREKRQPLRTFQKPSPFILDLPREKTDEKHVPRKRVIITLYRGVHGLTLCICPLEGPVEAREFTFADTLPLSSIRSSEFVNCVKKYDETCELGKCEGMDLAPDENPLIEKLGVLPIRISDEELGRIAEILLHTEAKRSRVTVYYKERGSPKWYEREMLFEREEGNIRETEQAPRNRG